MAVDTRNKRASCLSLGLPFGRVYPNPDGTIDSNDREQMSYVYVLVAATLSITRGLGRALMRGIGRM